MTAEKKRTNALVVAMLAVAFKVTLSPSPSCSLVSSAACPWLVHGLLLSHFNLMTRERFETCERGFGLSVLAVTHSYLHSYEPPSKIASDGLWSCLG